MSFEVRLVNKLQELGVPVYPIHAPMDTPMPCVTYQVVSERKKQVLDASIYALSVRFQVDVWSESYKEAKELSSRVITALVSLNATDILVREQYEPDTKTYRQIIDFYLKE